MYDQNPLQYCKVLSLQLIKRKKKRKKINYIIKKKKQNTGIGFHALLQGNLPNPGDEPRSPALQVDFLPSESQGNSYNKFLLGKIYVLVTYNKFLLGKMSLEM